VTGKVISIVNRKGGVGKTTFAIALADAFVSEHEADVTLLDLDPQGSASRILMSDEEFLTAAKEDKNLVGLIRAGLAGETPDLASIRRGMRHKIRDRGHVNFDLIPNSDRFWNLEAQEIRLNNAVRLGGELDKLLGRLVERSRYVIVDCPPGQAFSTLAVIQASDLILVPTTPDRLAVWGKELFSEYVRENARSSKAWFIVTRAELRPTEARLAMKMLQGQPDMLRVVGGTQSNYGDYDFAVFGEARKIQKRIQLENLQTLKAIYGDRGALELKNIARAVRRELGEDG
jgi:cellulose biosynthesis protein BcsQ